MIRLARRVPQFLGNAIHDKDPLKICSVLCEINTHDVMVGYQGLLVLRHGGLHRCEWRFHTGVQFCSD